MLVTASVTICSFPALYCKNSHKILLFSVRKYIQMSFIDDSTVGHKTRLMCCCDHFLINPQSFVNVFLYPVMTFLQYTDIEDKMVRVFLCIASPLRYLQNLNWILKSLTNQSRYSEIETQKRGNQNVPTNFYFSVVQ